MSWIQPQRKSSLYCSGRTNNKKQNLSINFCWPVIEKKETKAELSQQTDADLAPSTPGKQFGTRRQMLTLHVVFWRERTVRVYWQDLLVPSEQYLEREPSNTVWDLDIFLVLLQKWDSSFSILVRWLILVWTERHWSLIYVPEHLNNNTASARSFQANVIQDANQVSEPIMTLNYLHLSIPQWENMMMLR